MNFFCAEPGTHQLTEFIKLTFTGTDLNIYFNDDLIETREALPGECYYIQPFGSKKPPSIVKAPVPTKRGERICWGLSFVEKEKRAASYQDFLDRYFDVANSYNPKLYYVVTSDNDYAFLFAPKISKPGKKPSKKSENMKPLLAWVSDDICGEKFDKMLKQFTLYRNIHCPIQFLSL